MKLSENQSLVLARLSSCDNDTRIADLAVAVERDQSQVAAACVELSALDLVTLRETTFREVSLGPLGRAALDAGLPERVIVDVLIAQDGSCAISEVPNHCALSKSDVGQSLRWLAQRGWASKEGAALTVTDAGRSQSKNPTDDEKLLTILSQHDTTRDDALASTDFDAAAALATLSKRKGFVVVKDRADQFVALTDAGRARIDEGLSFTRSVNQLTPDMLSDGSWKDVTFRPYDVTLSAEARYPGKEHPFQRTMDKVRRVFLELGFSEIKSPWIESSFWDFDALFQPQDHPARDMQDTFYIAEPKRANLPDDALVERVKRVHEDGGDTGSTGWRYRWDRETAHKPVLRTHCTAATIRALAAHNAGESGKYFALGPVFRRETVDYKHLPVFHQVDGIIVDRNASLATLLGTLAAFYRKMGFPKIRFRPSFFPYTEPSAEVFLWLEERSEWVEMGGSGIFRPEVTRPLGIQDRVLAWGLGLERLAMMIHKTKAIGDLYFATMPWLRESPLCRS